MASVQEEDELSVGGRAFRKNAGFSKSDSVEEGCHLL
jgi:hypothetical protein